MFVGIERRDSMCYRFAGDGRYCVGCGKLHVHIHIRGAAVERTTEDIREAQYVVDLVGIVGAARGVDDIGGACQGSFARYFRIGVGEREDNGPRSHGAHHFRGEDIGYRQAYEYIGVHHCLGESGDVGTAGGKLLFLWAQI